MPVFATCQNRKQPPVTPGSFRKISQSMGRPADANAPVWLDSTVGFPVRSTGAGARTPPELLRKSELEHLTPFCDFKAKLFDLTKPEDLAEYTTVKDRVANGWYSIRIEDRKWPDDSNAPKVWLEWIEIYMTHDPRLAAQAYEDENY